jgi:hypothetical protein
MTDHHQERAERLVSSFQARLGEELCGTIGDEAFELLTQLVRQAIAEELAAAADRVEEVAREIRAEVERPELGL